MKADEILKKHEDANEMHFHEVDRKWIIEAMEEYAALRQPLVSGQSEQFGCYGCKHFNNCGIRMDYGNDGCDDKE